MFVMSSPASYSLYKLWSVNHLGPQCDVRPDMTDTLSTVSMLSSLLHPLTPAYITICSLYSATVACYSLSMLWTVPATEEGAYAGSLPGSELLR